MYRNKVLTLFVISSLLLFVTACGSSATSSKENSSPTSSVDADLTYVKQQVEKYQTLPKFVPPGPAFDAKKGMKGKAIFSIPVSSANPFSENIDKAMKQVADAVGFKLSLWENQGQPSQWVQGIDQAVNQKVDLIDLMAGVDPEMVRPQIEAAKTAGIKVVASILGGFDQTVPYVSAYLPLDYNQAGRILADWTILKTKGKANVLVLGPDEITSTLSVKNGLLDEFKTKSPGSKVTYVNVPFGDWATKLQTDVQAALVRDPSINYIIPIYDSMCLYVVPAITIAGATDRVKIATFDGTPFVLKMIQEGKVEMDIGENLDWMGKAIMDYEMRTLCGLPEVKNENMPLYIWDKSNIDKAGTPPTVSTGYGDAYIDGYNKLWGLSQ